MAYATDKDLLFDDTALIESLFGKAYLKDTATNISPDCNCSGYTNIEDDEEFSAAQIA